MAGQDSTVNSILDDLCETGETHGKVTLGQIREALGHRGFGPFFIVPALIEISPLGAVPGVPTLLALLISLFAGQIALGRRHMWLPDVVERRSLSADRLHGAVDKVRPVADWLDRWFHERLPRFAGPSARHGAAVLVLLLCLTVPFLELVPFASTGPMAAIALVGLAITVRDGALMLAAFAVAVLGLGGALAAWGGG